MDVMSGVEEVDVEDLPVDSNAGVGCGKEREGRPVCFNQ
jgi:hypothetical protein